MFVASLDYIFLNFSVFAPSYSTRDLILTVSSSFLSALILPCFTQILLCTSLNMYLTFFYTYNCKSLMVSPVHAFFFFIFFSLPGLRFSRFCLLVCLHEEFLFLFLNTHARAIGCSSLNLNCFCVFFLFFVWGFLSVIICFFVSNETTLMRDFFLFVFLFRLIFVIQFSLLFRYLLFYFLFILLLLA